MRYRTLFAMLLAAMLLIAGCAEESQKNIPIDKSPSSLMPISSVSGMMEYLKDVPSIKEISRWENPYGAGITIRTAHYKIHTTLLEPLMLRQMPGFMEAAYRQYNEQLPVAIDTTTIFNTYLFADRRQWESFTEKFAGPKKAPMYLAIKKGAYYLNGSCVAYNIGRNATFQVLGHEGWHQFNDKHFTYRLPSWLEEGIATLFETYEYKNGTFTFVPGRNGNRLVGLKMSIVGGKMIPLKDLIVLNPGQVVHGDQSAMISFYAQSYGLVRFLREENYGIRLKKYHGLLLDALYGKWPIDEQLARIAGDRNIPLTVRWNSFISPKLFSYYFGIRPEQLENEYRNFCNKLVYHIKVSNAK